MNIREGDAVKVEIITNPSEMNGDWAILAEENTGIKPADITRNKRAAPAEYSIGEWQTIEVGGVARTCFVTTHGPFRTKAELQKTLRGLPDGSYKVLRGSTKTWKSESTKRVSEVE
jgi:hypothetical protein